MIGRLMSGSPQSTARIAGLCYVVTILAGLVALSSRGSVGAVASLIGALSYVAVTLLFYYIFRPVSRSLSLLAALLSLAGCAVGPLGLFVRLPAPTLNISLVFFGCYCLLIGYLILKSTFLPWFLGALMLFAGVGWLTFASPALVSRLYPYVFVPGILGEGLLTLWLVLAGVDARRWSEQAAAQAAIVT